MCRESLPLNNPSTHRQKDDYYDSIITMIARTKGEILIWILRYRYNKYI